MNGYISDARVTRWRARYRRDPRPLPELLLAKGSMEGPFYKPTIRRWVFNLLRRIWNEFP